MNYQQEGQTVKLLGELNLLTLSTKQFPKFDFYNDLLQVDLSKLSIIDSAGIAYLAQIKAACSSLCFINASEKAVILSSLYGVDFLFKK